ncbi:MAG: hypothetical protein PQJ46_01515 [Spirochaetales bacterium]|nr:hypothetical protein [Spirochaetales bacterium]
MKKINLFIIFYLFVVSLAAYSLDDWDRAVNIYNQNSYLKAHQVIVTSKTFNDEGVADKNVQQFFNMKYNGKEEPEMIIVKATEDGKDTTERVRKLAKKRVNSVDSSITQKYEGITDHPLNPDFQDRIKRTQRKDKVLKDGYLCTVWDFDFDLNDNYYGKGTAWIDSKSGRAIFIEYGIKPDFPLVRNFTMRLEFDSDGGDSWVTRKLTMKGDFIFLLLNKSFESSTEMLDWQPEEIGNYHFGISDASNLQ